MSYRTIDDYARYLADKEQEGFGTKEFYEFQEAEEEDARIYAFGEGWNVAGPAVYGGDRPDYKPLDVRAAGIVDSIRPVAQAEIRSSPPLSKSRQAITDATTNALQSVGFSGRSAVQSAEKLIGNPVTGDIGIGDFAPPVLAEEGGSMVASGIDKGAFSDFAFGVWNILEAASPAMKLGEVGKKIAELFKKHGLDPKGLPIDDAAEAGGSKQKKTKQKSVSGDKQ